MKNKNKKVVASRNSSGDTPANDAKNAVQRGKAKKTSGKVGRKNEAPVADLLPPTVTDFYSMQRCAFLDEATVRPSKTDCIVIDQITFALESADWNTTASLLATNLPSSISSSASIRIAQSVGDPNHLPDYVPAEFKLAAPVEIRMLGGFDRQISVEPIVDLAVVVAKSVFGAKDHLNGIYFRRCTVYLAHCARILQTKCSIDSSQMSWSTFGDYPRAHCLIIQLKDNGPCIRLFACPERDQFKPSRFVPTTGNIRPKWYSNDAGDESVPPTPSYNQAVLAQMYAIELDDLLHDTLQLDATPYLRQALVLLKCWMLRRHLSLGLGSLSSTWLNAFLCHCVHSGLVNTSALPEHILRVLFTAFLETDFCRADQPLKLLNVNQTGSGTDSSLQPSWHQLAECSMGGAVFADPTGYLNLMHNTSASTLDRLKNAARSSLQLLTPVSDRVQSTANFQCLFVREQRFAETFDHVASLPITAAWRSWLHDHHQHQISLMDDACAIRCMYKLVAPIIKQALGERVVLLDVQRIKTDMTPVADVTNMAAPIDRALTFGLILSNLDMAHNLLQRGPPADLPEAAEFRRFWGRKSELRKFADGKVCEAVVWIAETISQHRLVPLKIIKHALMTHFPSACHPSPSVRFSGSQLDRVISREVHGHMTDTQENVFSGISQSLSKLSTSLRAVQGVPLIVTAITPISTIYKQTTPLVPVPYEPTEHQTYHTTGCLEIPTGSHVCVPGATADRTVTFRPTVEVQISLEQSGKWPTELSALRRVKAAFHLKLAELLHKQFQMCTQANADGFYVFLDGFTFVVYVAYEREVTITADADRGASDKARVSARALGLHKLLVLTPKLDAVIHGLGNEYGMYRLVCRVCKRWLAAHLLASYFNDQLVELLVARLFIHPQPFTEPRSVLVGFIRFLHLLSTHDWMTSPVIVNLNDQLTADDIGKLEHRFQTERATLPPMVVYSSLDPMGTALTRPHPSPPVLHRAVHLAKAASLNGALHSLFEHATGHDRKNITDADLVSTLFTPNLSIFDVVIHLDPSKTGRAKDSLTVNQDSSLVKQQPAAKKAKPATEITVIPVVDFDPSARYLDELKAAYDEMALFFHDPLGGTVIGVLFRPNLTVQSCSMNRANGRQLLNGELQPDFDVILEDMKLMGRGLVKKVERVVK